MRLSARSKGLSINDVAFGGRVGVSQKVTKSDGGFGLFRKPKVSSSTVGHFLGGGGGANQKGTKSDGGRRGGSAY